MNLDDKYLADLRDAAKTKDTLQMRRYIKSSSQRLLRAFRARVPGGRYHYESFRRAVQRYLGFEQEKRKTQQDREAVLFQGRNEA